jgi:hypothetical protein
MLELLTGAVTRKQHRQKTISIVALLILTPRILVIGCRDFGGRVLHVQKVVVQSVSKQLQEYGMRQHWMPHKKHLPPWHPLTSKTLTVKIFCKLEGFVNKACDVCYKITFLLQCMSETCGVWRSSPGLCTEACVIQAAAASVRCRIKN